MIPKRLELSNFLSYSEEPQILDFDKFRLVCLSGENGAGKSSLLDAVPWTIWGKSRSLKNNENFLRHGAIDAKVSFDFIQQGQRYRIIRIISRSGTKSSLNLQLLDDHQRAKSLTGASIMETQEKINLLIGITYETFRHTCFLSQGDADLFMKAKPAERKEAFAEILQILQYQRYTEKAKERANKIKTASELLKVKKETLAKDQERVPILKNQIKQKEIEMGDIKSKLAGEMTTNEELKKGLDTIAEKEKNLAIQEVNLRNTEQELEKTAAFIRDTKKKYDEASKVISEKQTIENNYKSHQDITKQLQQLKEQTETYYQLMSKKQELEIKFDANKCVIVNALDSLDKRKTEIESEQVNIQSMLKKTESVKKDIASIQKSIADIQQRFEQNVVVKKQFEEVEKIIHSLENHIKLEKEKTEKIIQDGRDVRELKVDVCPKCKTKLTKEHRELILVDLRKEYDRNQINLKDYVNQRELKEVEAKELKQDVVMFEKYNTELTNKKIEFTKKESELQQVEREMGKLERLKTAMSEIEAEQRQKQKELDMLESQKKDIIAFDEKLQQLGYDETRYRALEQRHKLLMSATDAYFMLKQVEKNIPEYEEILYRCEEETKNFKAERDSLMLQIERCRAELQVKKEKEKEFAVSQNEIQQLNKRITCCETDFKHWQQQLASLESQAEEVKKCEIEIKENEKNTDEYIMLQKAFDKDGIQSFLIQESIPQLETTANDILSRITKNGASIRIRTDEPSKSKKVLEIDISDATGGIRPYETFSGGERFRVDFALRIGLSKLLATQRNFNVQMLVIDEGFGTQDDDGVDAMIETLHAIEDDFEKIIVISHIDKVKDAFQDRIMIEKDARFGSRIVYT